MPVGDVVDHLLHLDRNVRKRRMRFFVEVAKAKFVVSDDVPVTVLVPLVTERARFRGCGHQGDHGKDSSHFACDRFETFY